MQSVLITGCNRGIGLGLVKEILRQEIQPKWIFATCRKPSEATELQQIASKNASVRVLQLELADFESYQNIYTKLANEVKYLNVLINNAGTAGKHSRLSFLKPQQMVDTFVVNVVAPLMLTKMCLPLLKAGSQLNKEKPLGTQRAAVINISSILGSIEDNKDGGYYSYRASKTGLNSITRSLSIDLKPHGILATCLHPGWVKTSMGGAKAPMTVEDSVEAIVKFVNNLTEINNGNFYSYDQQKIPW